MVRKLFFLAFLFVLAVLLVVNPNLKTVLAGVAILLFGMIMLEEGFKVFTKGPLQKILKNATDKLYKSISLGALVTAFIQSSSLVSVITISFISAGLISLAGGIGLIFGANIGTTATAWLVAGFGLKIKKNRSYQGIAQQNFSLYISEDPTEEANILLRKALLRKLQKQPDVLYNELLAITFT